VRVEVGLAFCQQAGRHAWLQATGPGTSIESERSACSSQQGAPHPPSSSRGAFQLQISQQRPARPARPLRPMLAQGCFWDGVKGASHWDGRLPGEQWRGRAGPEPRVSSWLGSTLQLALRVQVHRAKWLGGTVPWVGGEVKNGRGVGSAL
jgi:hypothetical protein